VVAIRAAFGLDADEAAARKPHAIVLHALGAYEAPLLDVPLLLHDGKDGVGEAALVSGCRRGRPADLLNGRAKQEVVLCYRNLVVLEKMWRMLRQRFKKPSKPLDSFRAQTVATRKAVLGL
jgi:hypothetical protein